MDGNTDAQLRKYIKKNASIRQKLTSEENASKIGRTKNISLSNGKKRDTIKNKELSGHVGQPITATDNQSVREWYVANVRDIPNHIDQSLSIEEKARQAFEMRNDLKRRARAAMSDEAAVNLLEKKQPVLTFDSLLEKKMREKT